MSTRTRASWITFSAALIACGSTGDPADVRIAGSVQALSSEALGRTEAADSMRVPPLEWTWCADGSRCAPADLPLDYAKPNGQTLRVAVTRLPAQDRSRRLGSLFVNFGGPGGDAVSTLQAFGKDLFAALNLRFDIVG